MEVIYERYDSSDSCLDPVWSELLEVEDSLLEVWPRHAERTCSTLLKNTLDV